MTLAALTAADRVLNGADARPFPVPVTGLEPVILGAIAALSAGDWWVPGLRERAGAVLREVPVERLQDPFAGCKPYKVAPVSPAPANRALYAVGLALADRDRAALVHLGIGSASDGAFHEALNLAALLRPTVIFLVAVHPLTGDAPLGKQLATSPSALAEAMGLPSTTVDGTDAAAVQQAVANALQQRGPHLIEATLESPT